MRAKKAVDPTTTTREGRPAARRPLKPQCQTLSRGELTNLNNGWLSIQYCSDNSGRESNDGTRTDGWLVVFVAPPRVISGQCRVARGMCRHKL